MIFEEQPPINHCTTLLHCGVKRATGTYKNQKKHTDMMIRHTNWRVRQADASVVYLVAVHVYH